MVAQVWGGGGCGGVGATRGPMGRRGDTHRAGREKRSATTRIIVRNETLASDEVTHVTRRAITLPVTTPPRTAFDLGRHLPRDQALARLDALARAAPFSAEDVLLLAKRYRGARGLRRLTDVLPLVDGGAASPKESWLRLLLVDAGFPTPTTQIPVHRNWRLIGVLDMGWGTTWSQWSTTATNTEPIAANSSGISTGSRRWKTVAGW